MLSQLFGIVKEVMFQCLQLLDQAYGKMVIDKKAIENGKYPLVVH